MTGSGERAEDAALWQRWRALSPAAGTSAAAGDPNALAAYAEGRLDEAMAEPVEASMFDDPELLDDVIAARALAQAKLPDAAEPAIAAAMALVPPQGAQILAFPKAPSAHSRGGFRMAMTWGGLAASLLITGFFGFTLGSNAYLNLTTPAVTESAFHEILDPPGGLFLPTGGEQI